VERLNAYRDAGADCLFAPGVRDAETIEQLAKAVKGPLNVLAQPGSPSVVEMKALGVARVSFGSGTSRVALAALRGFVTELRSYGTFAALV
jgi:2-methylisocitrate lyase-like PEP mutase family enzyme